jgi:hypothetical protein
MELRSPVHYRTVYDALDKNNALDGRCRGTLPVGIIPVGTVPFVIISISLGALRASAADPFIGDENGQDF